MSAWPWPAPVDDGGAAHLVAGLPLPGVTLPTTSGRAFSFASEPGLVVAFCYTWTGRAGVPNPPDWDAIAGAHGSTAQAEGFRDLHDGFSALGARVIGISTQGTPWQQELVQRLGLPFDLASDAGLQLATALRLPTFQTGGETYLRRLTLICRGGRIDRVHYPVHPPDLHAADVLVRLRAAAARP